METQFETDTPSSAVEATYKAVEVEGWLDRLFYRKIGFQLARFFALAGMTPTAVTTIGGVCGIIAGHLYYYRDLTLNIFGMLLQVLANALDNADGQLARLTNQQSRTGRVVDSVADHLIWASIYFHLAIRCLVAGSSPGLLVLVVGAALSHGWQGALADYFRNSYLLLAEGRSRAAADSSVELKREIQEISWRREPWTKFLLSLYRNFTLQQELFAPKLCRLRKAAGETPTLRFRTAARPMLKWWGFALTNTRMLFLFLFLLVGQTTWFFWLQLTALNLLVAILLIRQEHLAGEILEEIAA